jgi:hypothetical protein
MNDEAANTSHTYYATEPFWGRFWRKLGFHWGHVPYLDDSEEDGWAPGSLIVETGVHLDWLNRFRVLISGNLHVGQRVKTDVSISRSKAVSRVGVLPPGTKIGTR